MPGQPNPVPPDDLSRRLTVARPDEEYHTGAIGAIHRDDPKTDA